MEPVELRFTRFKRFVAQNASGASMLALFMNMPLGPFLQTVHAKSQEGMSVEDITSKVLDYAGMRRESFAPETIEKFQLYIEYFTEVSRQLYQ